MKEKIGALDLLQHSRHDWMNRLQIIKGNLELANVERAREVIEEIVIEMRQEAQLSALGVPHLSEWLLTYNWVRRARLMVKFEVLTDGRLPIEMDPTLYEWLKGVVDKLEQSVCDGVDNELYFIMEIDQEQSAFHVTIEYEGGELKDSPKNWLKDINCKRVEPALTWYGSTSTQFAVKASFELFPVSR
ncbi:Spo0B domain-containing protein [Jeotgalibacillus soli]|uniref:Sporulation initiation phosphotransferase B C-terminal domain-containing protein n=1 Tax=Jeotgalibacillus soli TaxID=889306 RepID=A0A0C2R2S4_9BACL|nr:Spo0B domain-containing protein [Jeotgalibacillus soli]KIL44545.1 hypothetical protein KP78_35090 [Jeotgalibacillus soli]